MAYHFLYRYNLVGASVGLSSIYEPPTWRSAPASSSWVLSFDAAVVSYAIPSPLDSVDPTSHASLEMDITYLIVDIVSDLSSEPIRLHTSMIKKRRS